MKEEVVGQITINLLAKGRPEITMKGEIKPRVVVGLNRLIQIAYRQYTHSITRSKGRVDMSDKGATVKDSMEPAPAPDATQNIFDAPPPQKPPETEELVVEDTLSEDTTDEAPEGAEKVDKAPAPASDKYKVD